MLEHLVLTAESGLVGGLPAAGLDFGAAENTDAVVAQNQLFDFYDGGGLDLAVLGMAEADATGNVIVSRVGPKLVGPGGFINISQSVRRVVFAGTFTAGGLEMRVGDGALAIVKVGSENSSTGSGRITFSGSRSTAAGQPVLYVTERCVFQLDAGGLRLIETAPGIDLERDILAHMALRPKIGDVAEMGPAPLPRRADGPEERAAPSRRR